MAWSFLGSLAEVTSCIHFGVLGCSPHVVKSSWFSSPSSCPVELEDSMGDNECSEEGAILLAFFVGGPSQASVEV